MSDVATSAIRRELHTLLDRIPDGDVPTARKILRALVDPVEWSLLTAPIDDEPLSAHERTALEEADRRAKRGDPLVAHEEVLSEFGTGESGQ